MVLEEPPDCINHLLHPLSFHYRTTFASMRTDVCSDAICALPFECVRITDQMFTCRSRHTSMPLETEVVRVHTSTFAKMKDLAWQVRVLALKAQSLGSNTQHPWKKPVTPGCGSRTGRPRGSLASSSKHSAGTLYQGIGREQKRTTLSVLLWSCTLGTCVCMRVHTYT